MSSEQNWQQNETGLFGGRNQVLLGDGFYISYNPNPAANFPMFGADGSDGETALCKDGTFRILNGDWREDYAALLSDGYEACEAFYNQHKDEHASSWTEA